MRLFNIYKGIYRKVEWLKELGRREEALTDTARQRIKILDFFDEIWLIHHKRSFWSKKVYTLQMAKIAKR